MYKFGIFVLLSTVALLSQMTAAERTAPRHLISYTGALTEPSAGSPREIAEKFLQNAAPSLGLSADDLAGVYIAKQYRTEHNGVTHFVFRQTFNGVDVHGAAFTINVDREGRVLNAGGDLMKRPSAPAPDVQAGARALRSAVREINPKLDGSYLAGPVPPQGEKFVKFARGGFTDETEGKPVWYSLRGELRPAWVFYIAGDDGVSRYIAVVDSQTERLLEKRNLTHYQQAQPPAQGLVFERESPQPNPTPGVRNENRPYVQRTLQSFQGDPAASPRGWVDGTETVGNNVIAGGNPAGRSQITNPVPATAADRNFSFPLEIGPGAPNPTNFRDAVTTNLFYWANQAHDKFYKFGFDEAAGNFQQDNFGRGGVGGDPMLAYSQFGVAADAAARTDNAFFTSNRSFEDGARVSINMFIFASNDVGVFADGSLDAEVIVHEYTHGVSNRLVEGAYGTFQGASMGEAWSDYYSLEFTLPEGVPADGYYAVGEYATQNFAVGIRTRPYSTNMDINPLTFGQMGTVAWYGPEVHASGEIWMEILWEARAALVRQFGEKEGRRRMAQLVIDGMKLSPPRPSMVDERDAILLADRVNNKGESQTQLWEAFAKRGLGVTAFSATPDSIAVTESFAKPSNSATLRFQFANYNMGDNTGETVRVLLNDANLTSPTALVQLTSSSGDLENLVLRKSGELWSANITLGTDGVFGKFDSYLDVLPGDAISAYYVDADTGSGAKLIETTAPVTPGYSITVQRDSSSFTSGTERTLLSIPPGSRQLPTSPAIISLPFPFKFYGQDYRVIFVYPNGHISLGGSTVALDPCNTDEAATQFPVIAPLWMELVYGGPGQRNENVYYSTGPGSATIRWAAETVFTGEPVNFSVVLYDDGRIMFQYGAGNNDLVSSPLFGCTASTPLIGISNGRGTFVQRVEDFTGVANLGSAPSVILDPPYNYSSFPVVTIETPEADAAYAGILTIKGIAYDPNDAIARLDVLIDGIPRRLILPTISRTDFCNTQRVRNCPNVGFQTSFDTNLLGLKPGTHTVQIRATNTRGAIKNFPDQPMTITVEPGQSRVPVGKIETPAEAAELSENTTIRGYVYAQDVRITAVDVLIDGVTYGRATYNQRRDDICSTLDPRPLNCPNIGFTFTLNTLNGALQLPNGAHQLQVRALDEAGRYTLIPDTAVVINVKNEANSAPKGTLISPAPNQRLSGIVKIWGWAWDPDGTVRTVRLLVDGIVFNSIPLGYGDDRAEQCNTVPELHDVAACPNIGFYGDFDTTIFPNGIHQLGILITDDKGRTTVVPSLSSEGMNVTIDNPR